VPSFGGKVFEEQKVRVNEMMNYLITREIQTFSGKKKITNYKSQTTKK